MSVKRKTTVRIEVGDLENGRRYLNAKDELESFRELNKELLAQYEEVAERFNSAVQAVDTELRAKCAELGMGVSFEDFQFKYFQTTVDAERCFELVGGDQFKAWGGTTHEVTEHKMNKDKFLMLVDQEEVPADIQQSVLKYTPNYSKPKVVKP